MSIRERVERILVVTILIIVVITAFISRGSPFPGDYNHAKP